MKMRNIIKEWFTEKADDKRRKVEADAELAIELAEIDAVSNRPLKEAALPLHARRARL